MCWEYCIGVRIVTKSPSILIEFRIKYKKHNEVCADGFAKLLRTLKRLKNLKQYMMMVFQYKDYEFKEVCRCIGYAEQDFIN